MPQNAADGVALWGFYTIQQTSSKLPADVFKIHVLMLDVCWIV